MGVALSSQPISRLMPLSSRRDNILHYLGCGKPHERPTVRKPLISSPRLPTRDDLNWRTTHHFQRLEMMKQASFSDVEFPGKES